MGKNTNRSCRTKDEAYWRNHQPDRNRYECCEKIWNAAADGVYGSKYNQFPLGNIFERNVKIKMGQAPVIHYMPMLFKMITEGELDPTEIVSHKMRLDQASEAIKSLMITKMGVSKLFSNPDLPKKL